MARQRFNASERDAIKSGRAEVRDGRTWYPVSINAPITTDCIGCECVQLTREVGKGTGWGYPGHVRPIETA